MEFADDEENDTTLEESRDNIAITKLRVRIMLYD
jgi:hypothetical protein